jgi:hypothetical protein
MFGFPFDSSGKAAHRFSVYAKPFGREGDNFLEGSFPMTAASAGYYIGAGWNN